MTKPDVYFRANVGLLILNAGGLVLGLERSDFAGSWQAPQGGIQQGEQPMDAAARELREETGIPWSQVTVLDEFPEWLVYELPEHATSAKTGRGQAQKWFLLRMDGPDARIDLGSTAESPEFVSWRWMPLLELIPLSWTVKRPVYERLAHHWRQHLSMGASADCFDEE